MYFKIVLEGGLYVDIQGLNELPYLASSCIARYENKPNTPVIFVMFINLLHIILHKRIRAFHDITFVK